MGISESQCVVGTPVNYYSFPGAAPFKSKIRSEAWPLGHGQMVVMIEGKAGGVALTHLEIIEEPQPAPAE